MGRKEQTENNIIEAAVRLFAEKGVRETSVREIASAAGCSAAIVFKRFTDKDSIIRIIIDLLAEFHEHYGYNTWSMDKFREMDDRDIADAIMSFTVLEFPKGYEEYYLNIYKVVLQEQFHNPAARAAAIEFFYQKNHDYIHGILSELSEAGYIACDDIGLVAKIYAETVYYYACGESLGYAERSPVYKGVGMANLLKRILSRYIRRTIPNPQTLIVEDKPDASSVPLLRRPRLNSVFREIFDSGKHSALVIAPAGAGKTCAIQSFLENDKERRDVVVEWEDASTTDQPGERFWESFTRGVCRFDAPLAANLAEIGFPESEGAFQKCLNIIRPALNKNIVYYFVFDNFENATPIVCEFMQRMIKGLKTGRLRVIIASREMPPFRMGDMGFINRDDLLFTHSEIIEYFKLLDVNLPDRYASMILRDTQGWAYLLNLLAYAVANNGGKLLSEAAYIESVNAAKRLSGGFMGAEAFDSLSPTLQKILIMLNLIPSAPIQQVYEVKESERSALSIFARYNPLTETYSVQPYAAEFLKSREVELTGENKRNLFSKMAQWLFKNNQYNAATRYYAMNRDWEGIVNVVLSMPLSVSDAFAESMLEVINVIEPQEGDELDANFSFLKNATQPRLLMNLRRYREADKAAKEAIARLEAADLPHSHFQIMLNNVVLGMIRVRSNNATRKTEFAGYFKEAVKHYNLCPEGTIMPLKNCRFTIIPTYSGIVAANAPAGAIDRFLEELDESMPCVARIMEGLLAGAEVQARCEAAFFRNRLAEAKTLAYEAILQAHLKGQHDIEAHARGYLLRILIFEGDDKGVIEQLSWFEDSIHNTGSNFRFGLRDYVLGWTYSHFGITDRVADWIRYATVPTGTLLHEAEIRIRSRYLIVERRFEEALRVMNVEISPLENYLFFAVGTALNKAYCHFSLGDFTAAADCLRKAYNVALPHELLTPFIERGAEFVEMADKLGEIDGIPAEWLKTMAAKAAVYAKKKSFVLAAIKSVLNMDADIDLTQREAAVLKDLYHGLTYPEMATHQGVSINAIKQAQQLLYGKLGATNGIDAVRIAQERRLI
ncbi:MAG: TetR family transcriptional regulator [Oscillospiraceae bacterium]|jgi:ATP/maltotriose-dependent transcriptional regulator MalT/AcrR family transcriptional regulator|nr:TetR family transcriptional regulator [Oscillospiraceae bacterium]